MAKREFKREFTNAISKPGATQFDCNMDELVNDLAQAEQDAQKSQTFDQLVYNTAAEAIKLSDQHRAERSAINAVSNACEAVPSKDLAPFIFRVNDPVKNQAASERYGGLTGTIIAIDGADEPITVQWRLDGKLVEDHHTLEELKKAAPVELRHFQPPAVLFKDIDEAKGVLQEAVDNIYQSKVLLDLLDKHKRESPRSKATNVAEKELLALVTKTKQFSQMQFKSQIIGYGVYDPAQFAPDDQESTSFPDRLWSPVTISPQGVEFSGSFPYEIQQLTQMSIPGQVVVTGFGWCMDGILYLFGYE